MTDDGGRIGGRFLKAKPQTALKLKTLIIVGWQQQPAHRICSDEEFGQQPNDHLPVAKPAAKKKQQAAKKAQPRTKHPNIQSINDKESKRMSTIPAPVSDTMSLTSPPLLNKQTTKIPSPLRKPDGISLDKEHLPRFSTVQVLYETTKRTNFVVLSSPASTGKTSLLQLLTESSQRRQERPQCLSC